MKRFTANLTFMESNKKKAFAGEKKTKTNPQLTLAASYVGDTTIVWKKTSLQKKPKLDCKPLCERLSVEAEHCSSLLSMHSETRW